jgi:hypothetical protein
MAAPGESKESMVEMFFSALRWILAKSCAGGVRVEETG